MTPSNLEQLADEVVKFVAARAWVTTGMREDLKKLIMAKARPLVAPEVQPGLFDVCASRHGGNQMSNAAAEDGQARRSPQKRRIWVWLHERGERGATVEETANALAMRYTTVSARCSEMKSEGIIKESGRARETETKSAAHVLVVNLLNSTKLLQSEDSVLTVDCLAHVRSEVDAREGGDGDHRPKRLGGEYEQTKV